MVKIKYYEREGSTQYAGVDITHPVRARYSHAPLDNHEGNRLIEALPLPWEGKETINGYIRRLPGYRTGRTGEMTCLEKILQIRELTRVRFPLLYHQQLEDEFYSALVTSYETRKTIRNGIDDRDTFVIKNREEKAGSILCGDPADATTGTFSLIGFGGAGKSSSIKILTSHYPQVILHEDEYGVTPQIVYLVVNCAPNSNFTSLFQGVGAAIDLALENSGHFYERMIAKEGRLGRMTEKVRELIEKFSIGAIIFDEIQLLEFNSAKEGSFDALLTLSNRTKAAIIAVGTEDAMEKMFRTLRTGRRTGAMIDACNYCADKQYFRTLVNMLFYYQWFDAHVSVTDEIVNTLYELTHGIIDQLIALYMRANLDYVRASKKPKQVDGEYFRHVSRKYFRGMQKLLDKMDYEGAFELNRNVKAEMDEFFMKEEQKAQAETIEREMGSIMDEQLLLENVTVAIQAVSDASAADIEDAYKKVMAGGEAEGKSEHEIIKMVNVRIMAPPKPKKSKPKAKRVDLMNIQTDRKEA